jgi:hypothetical protein
MPNPSEMPDMLAKFSETPVFAFLLNSDPKHPIAEVVRNNWSQIHHLTGEKIFLVAFDPPPQWSKSIKLSWQKVLGKEFRATWAIWQHKPDAGEAFRYLGFFDPPLNPSQLPCLVFFTNLKTRKALVRSLPNWDSESLYRLLTSLLERALACAARPPKHRFHALEKALTSPQAIAISHASHAGQKVWAFLKKDPVFSVTVTLSFILALSTQNLLALSPAAVAALRDIKSAFAGLRVNRTKLRAISGPPG